MLERRSQHRLAAAKTLDELVPSTGKLTQLQWLSAINDRAGRRTSDQLRAGSGTVNAGGESRLRPDERAGGGPRGADAPTASGAARSTARFSTRRCGGSRRLIVERSEHVLELDRAIEQREANKQCF